MKRVLLIALFSVVFALAITGCGSSSTPPFQATGTAATVQMGDATDPAIVKFELSITAITLTGVSPTTTTGNLLSKPAEFEFVHTAGTLEPLTLGNIPAGTYSDATISWSNPEVVVVNGTTPTKVPATPASGTATVKLAPLVVTSSPLFLNFDLDLAASIKLTGTAPITGATVSPTFAATSASTPPAGNEGNEDHDNGEIEDVHGKVTAIAAPSFTIDTGSATITFATDTNTKFKDGITQLSDLKVGDIVEVDGMTKADGSKLATKVEREGGSNGHEVEGVISTLDSPLTKITVAHQVDSDNSNANSAPVTVDITVNSSTVFSVRGDKINVTGTFDATHIGKGQRIEADANATATPIVATKIKLREQALVGTVAATPAPTSAGFTLTIDPASAFGKLSGASSVAVTFASGSKVLVTPAAGATVRVRGLVFVNGTTYTMTAVRGDDNK